MNRPLTQFLLVAFLVVWLIVGFIVPSPRAAENSWVLRIPEGTCVVGTFNEFRSLKEEYQLLCKLYFAPGDHNLPLEAGEYTIYLFNKVEFGPGRQIGIPRRSGNLTVEREGSRVFYTIRHEVDFADKTMSLEWPYLSVELQNGQPVQPVFVMEEPYLSQNFYLTGRIEIGGEEKWIDFASETYEGLPAWLTNVHLADGQAIRLYFRYQPPFAGSGPANLIYAEVDMKDYQVKQSDYWKLVYAAEHHNWNEKFLVLFDVPIGNAYGIVYYGREIFESTPPQVFTVDQDLNHLEQIGVVKSDTESIEAIPLPSAVRGWESY